MIERTDHDRDTEIHESRERIVALESQVATMLASPVYANPDPTEREKALEQTVAELRAQVKTQQEVIQRLMLGPAQVPTTVGGMPSTWPPVEVTCVDLSSFTTFPPTSLVMGGERRPPADLTYRGPAVNIGCEVFVGTWPPVGARS
jgi:hypothetical protein